MPKLIYSSETAGCGATIELHSEDICTISVAQSGVLVRSYRKGLFGAVFGTFLGPTLYNEKNIYAAAKTAMALSELVPEQIPSLGFRNPVLTAFANAVWGCASAAEVSVLLNEAAVKARSEETRPAASVSQPSQPSRETIIADFGELMERRPPLPTRIEDVSVLPHPKSRTQ